MLMVTERYPRSNLPRTTGYWCADAESCGPVFEPLEPRQLLDGIALMAVDSLVASSPAVDPANFSYMAQAAPVVGPAAVVSAFPLDQTFLLHSDPGALKVIYLDFDGHTTTGTSWNTLKGLTEIVTPAYSFEGDSSFSDNELARIQYIWQRVVEDYIPFDVDVTTQDPGSAALIKTDGSDSQYGVRVCIGGDSSWYGSAIGGIAYVGSFSEDSDTPCFVFPANLSNGDAKYTAEATLHESGHTLGLSHDGVTGGTDYYYGQGSGPTGWAPIMGCGYDKELTQWSKGEYTDANNQQDDLAILAGSIGGFGYRADDHGGTIASAAGLAVTPDMNVSGSGIIERTADLDFFYFTTGEGLVSLWINPAPQGPDLDILATLYDSSGTVVAVSNPIKALEANFIDLSLLAGTYYLSIDGTGEGDPLVAGYSDYGSLGQYFITGTIVDPGPLPEVTIVASDAAASELGPDPGTFTILRTGGTEAAMVVSYTVSGSAGNGVDYQQIPTYVTIPAGAASAIITIAPIDDTLLEGDETVVLTLQGGPGFLVGQPGAATITIADYEILVTIVASDASAAELGPDAGTFTVSRTGGTESSMVVSYSVSGSAGNGVDYQQIPAYVTIPAGAASAIITITPIDDLLREGDETVVLTLQGGTGFLVGVPGAATIIIADHVRIISADDFAISETTTYGTIVFPGLANTLASDNVYEQLKEEPSNSKPKGSRLEHRWTFNVTGGGVVTFFVEAYHTANTEGDDFTFAYSTDGMTWTTLLTVTKTADDNKTQQAALPGGLFGTVYIRVKDTNNTPGKKILDSLYIDKMFIHSDPGIPGDANVDGIVNIMDYMTLKRNICMAGGAAWTDGDFDQDGDVDYADLSVVMANFGRVFVPAAAPAPIVPEPAPAAEPTDPVEADPADEDEIIPSPDTTIAPSSPAPDPIPPAPAKSPDSTMKMLAAMADAARNARIDALAAVTTRLPNPPFATRNNSPLLPWWLRPKRSTWPLTAE